MIDALKVWQLGSASEIEGRISGSDSSVIVVDMPPGPGPALHRRPYAETFVVPEGRARFTIEGRDVEASAGSVVVAPPNAAHAFENPGPGRLLQVDIHASDRFITEWLAPEAERPPGAVAAPRERKT
ncbi:cupin domain-containing protein [Bradyrhizobium septentrionale]|uniref:Cupin domain-containing protein n=1 Tax=Bradyrhizobium septentrionale TaxID=1404411 RepID=A0A973W1Q9_9BRAD|nr:cupin domain-containing protein [Bradyrhizobium septentrionale]UGY14654.1 cupin domain-containing protein [Bradyrhizobium septentrionale]UGY23228.1 cupin domain-containing protein [Bradyrhizobium septentrionale]